MALSIKYKSKQIKNSFQLCKRYLSRMADGRTQRHLRFSRISSASNENVELFCHWGVYSVSISIRNPHVASNKSDCSLLLIVPFSNMSYGDRVEGLKQWRNTTVKKKQVVSRTLLKCKKKTVPLTLEITGFYAYLHQHFLWMMSHEMAVNLSLICKRVVCAKKKNQLVSGITERTCTWTSVLRSLTLNAGDVCCVIIRYAKEIKGLGAEISLVWFGWESVERKYCWLKFVTWKLYCAEFWSIRILYKALLLNSCLCRIRTCLCSGSDRASTLALDLTWGFFFGKLLQICN